MEDNGTVIQLKNALNQLLNAYESLKAESEQLKLENKKIIEDLQNLEDANSGLNDKLASLNDTSDHHSSEMGEMLDRIESILGTDSDDSEKYITESFESEEELSLSAEVESIMNDEKIDDKTEDTDTNNTKDIDLGRMQTLLNGFNN